MNLKIDTYEEVETKLEKMEIATVVNTPDFFDFCNNLDKLRNKDDFTEWIKDLGRSKGLKLTTPHDYQRNCF